MSNGSKPKRDEHFVPIMHLQHFAACKHEKDKKNKGLFVWAYSLEKMEPLPDQVPISSICFQKDSYEFRDRNGNIIDQNRVENALSRYEEDISVVIKNIIRKAECSEELQTADFLTEDEKETLVMAMTLQILRLPQTIGSAEELAPTMISDKLTVHEARTIAIWSCLEAFLNGSIKSEKPSVYSKVAAWFQDMTFVIGRCEEPVLFTSDHPIYLYHKDKDRISFDKMRPQKVVFPLSSTLVLFLVPRDQMPKNARSVLANMKTYDIHEAQWSIACSAREWIYSRVQFSDDALILIADARKK